MRIDLCSVSMAASRVSCLSGLLTCCQGPSFTSTASYAHLHDELCVCLDASTAGTDVVLVKAGSRICGRGAALSNAPLVQNKAYWEVKIQQTGTWGLGVATNDTNTNELPLGNDGTAWVLREDSHVYNCSQQYASMDTKVEEGDGLSYDHVELKFYVNGQATNTMLTGLKGIVYPVLYVADDAILDVKFSHFWYDAPSGFGEIMLEKTIL